MSPFQENLLAIGIGVVVIALAILVVAMLSGIIVLVISMPPWLVIGAIGVAIAWKIGKSIIEDM